MHRYTARVGDAVTIAEDVSYDRLVTGVLEFVLNAAVAKAADDFEWEHEEVRRRGLRAIDFFCDGRAVWWDRESFEAEKGEAEREGIVERFTAANELDLIFFDAVDAGVRERLRRAGYATQPLATNMKELYKQIEADAGERCARARDALVAEILGS